MPSSEWFVLKLRDAKWVGGPLGTFCEVEPESDAFDQVGINISVLQPGEAMTMYHREDAQEGFLILEGECVLIVAGEERPLRKWDFFHCPAGIPHAIVGAGDGSVLVLAVGARPTTEVVYEADPLAQKHGAAVAVETTSPKEAYAGMEFPVVAYKEGWLPD